MTSSAVPGGQPGPAAQPQPRVDRRRTPRPPRSPQRQGRVPAHDDDGEAPAASAARSSISAARPPTQTVTPTRWKRRGCRPPSRGQRAGRVAGQRDGQQGADGQHGHPADRVQPGGDDRAGGDDDHDERADQQRAQQVDLGDELPELLGEPGGARRDAGQPGVAQHQHGGTGRRPDQRRRAGQPDDGERTPVDAGDGACRTPDVGDPEPRRAVRDRAGSATAASTSRPTVRRGGDVVEHPGDAAAPSG